MLYGSCIWSSTSCDNIDRVYKLQNRAACVILDADREKRTVSLLNQLDWLPFKQKIIMQKCCLIFRQITGDSPSYMTDLFVRNSDVHNRASRHGYYNLVCPHYNRETEGGRTFRISGIKLWDSIPIDVLKKETVLLK